MTTATMLATWFAAHGLEFVAVVFGIVSVLLSVRQNIWSWPTALVNVALFFALFYKSGLYSDMGLQGVYFVLSLYGWYEWLYGGTDKSTLPVTRTPARTWFTLAAIGVLFWIVDATVIARAPGASLPYVDALLVTISLVAQYLMTKKRLENWALWIVADIAYVGMFVFKGLYLTAANYAVYLALAVLGHAAWKRSLMVTA
jgi:nicotinamide mononucleotide transporter